MRQLLFTSIVFMVSLTPIICASENPELNRHVVFGEPAEQFSPQTPPSAIAKFLIIESENFEEIFPSGLWWVGGGATDAYWDDVNCLAATGNWSAWCAAGGSGAQPPCYLYTNNMGAWMTYGPFDLSDATSGFFDFWFFLQEELGYDRFFFGVSDTDVDYYGYWVDTNFNDWTYASADFANVPGYGSFLGKENVWIGFIFNSDANNTHYGAYVDDVGIYKAVPDTPTPTPGPGQLGVEISLPSNFVHPFDTFYIDGYVNVPTDPLVDVNLAFVLDVYGTYFFWPSWSRYPTLDWQYYSSFGVGKWYIKVLPTFIWPDTGTSSASNLVLYGMLLDYEVTHVIGNIASVTFGYGP